MVIDEINEVTDEVYQAFQRLIPQLTRYSPPPTREALQVMVKSTDVFVFIARHPTSDDEIVGTATLGTFVTPTGRHGWIEDVVVDKGARRQGIGEALTQACIEKARSLSLGEVNLTSNPSRVAANKLYQQMGFIQRDTNVYRLSLD